MASQKLDVKQAAQALGISTDAVHKRARRGSLDSEKGPDGRVYVWLDVEENTPLGLSAGARTSSMFAKVANHYLNLNNIADVVDNGEHLIVRFNFINPTTQQLQALRVSGNEAERLRARLDELAHWAGE